MTIGKNISLNQVFVAKSYKHRKANYAAVNTLLAAGKNLFLLCAFTFITYHIATAQQGVGNYVWLDSNEDGVQNPNEKGLSYITVTLYDVNNNVVAVTRTDALGAYFFNNLPVGDYQIRISEPIDYAFSPKNVMTAGGNSATDSDIHTNGYSDVFTLVANVNNNDMDAGLHFAKSDVATVNSFVWLDADANGIQDAGETSMSGVGVMLMDNIGNVIQSTLTDGKGYYQLSTYNSGSYHLAFRLPFGYTFTEKNAIGSNANNNSDVNDNGTYFGKTDLINLVVGNVLTGVDAGLVPSSLANMGSFVWNDINQDGLQQADEPGVGNVSVVLRDTFNNIIGTTVTDGLGYYTFTHIPTGIYYVSFGNPAGFVFTQDERGMGNNDSDVNPINGNSEWFIVKDGDKIAHIDAGMYLQFPAGNASIGDLLWFDNDKNGLQDAKEAGISGVTVLLYDAMGNLLQKTLTNKTGNYRFANLAAGTYSIEFVNLPKGFVFTPAYTTTGTNNNKAQHDGRIYDIVLASNAARMDIDAGLYVAGSQIGKGSIANRAWNDINVNGMQDVEEVGVKDIQVTLYAADGTTVLATAKTDGEGEYIFSNLAKGKYFVEFGNLPANFNFVAQYAGSNIQIDSDVDALGKTAAIFVGQGENITGIDAGINNPFVTGRIGNFVWNDTNNNGVQNTGELGVPNISVTLYDNNNVRIATTLTDENGNYQFTNIAAGSYYLHFHNLPAGYTLGQQMQGGNTATDSDPHAVTGLTSVFAFTNGQNKNNVDAAIVMNRAMIGNYVWYDENVNGVQDITESGLEGVTVSLYNNLNALISSTVTLESGQYYFPNINPGQYYLSYTTCYHGLFFTHKDTVYVGASNNNDSDVNPTTAKTDVFSVASSNINTTFDAGLVSTKKGSLNGYAWDDRNEDGIQDANEPAEAGILVTLYDFDGISVLSNAVTDANGLYSFDLLPAADYIIGFSGLPFNYGFTEVYQGSNIYLDNDADKTGLTGTFTLLAGENEEAGDVGIKNQNITIGDFVFDDKNQDGYLDDIESGIANVTVTLYNGIGEILSVTKTDAYGRYYFHNQPLGDYQVGFTLPVDYVFSPLVGGGNKDNDVSPITGRTGVFSITYTSDTLQIDAGMYFSETVLSSIGDYIWFDSNSNGLQDANEKGMSNMAVSLFDSNNRLLLTTITNQRGFYQFLDIPAGNYFIVPTLPHGYTYTVSNMGLNDNLDSEDITDMISLGAAEKWNNWDMGLRRLLSSRPDVGDKVWNDLNQNGIQDADEPGVAGVTLSLYSSNNTFLSSTKTDRFGNYLFANLVHGLYKIVLTLPSGWSHSPLNVGNVETDNDFQVNHSTSLIVLSEGDKIIDIDAGIFENAPAGTAAFGNKVWFDVNQNGLQDAQEPGIAGITVILLNNTLSAIDSTTTDINGDFGFKSLAAGTYYIKYTNLPEGMYFTTKDADGMASSVVDSDPNELTGITDAIVLAAGIYDASIDAGLINQTTNSGRGSIGNLIWYDRNANGQQDADEAGVSNVQVTLTNLATSATLTTKTDGLGNYIFNDLAAGNYVINIALPATYTFSPQNATTADKDSDINPANAQSNTIVLLAGEANMSIDAGMYITTGTASVGSRVWNDSNNNGVQDANEGGVPGVVVTLYDNELNSLSITSTDNYGKYLFGNLNAGLYTLGFENLPEGYLFSLKDQNSNDNTDSDVRPNMAITAPFYLSAGMSKMNLAAGIYTTSRVALGDYVWYDANNDGLQTTGELPVIGATVIAYDGGLNEVAKSVTDDAGHYYFANLFPGSYWIGFRTLAPGAKLTTYQIGGGANGALDSDANASALSDEFVMLAGSAKNDVDAGIGTSAAVAISGYAWYDYQTQNVATNGNALQDAGEKAAVGVSVGLYPATSATLLATAITDAEGMYYFQGLTVGAYRLKINALPMTTRAVLQDQGNDAIDSDIDPVFLQSPAYSTIAGQHTDAADIGLIPPASITGTTFTDGQLNVLGSADGFQNNQIPNNSASPLDSTIAGVSVLLIDDLTGNVLRNTYTTEKGEYFFRNLADDIAYRVAFEEFPTFCPTCPYTFFNADNNVNDSTDSDANAANLMFYAGKNYAQSDVVNGLSPIQLRKNVDGGYAFMGSILPAKILNLAVEWQGNDGLVTWQTSEEENVAHFAVERSLDKGITFEEISKVGAVGNSSELKNYDYTDNNIGNTTQNIIYYRLRIADQEGKEKYSDMVSLQKTDFTADMNLELYPNPTQDVVHINYQVQEAGKITFYLRNELGQTIDKKVFTAQNRPLSVDFNLEKYPSGKYFIEMHAPSDVLTKVIIKE